MKNFNEMIITSMGFKLTRKYTEWSVDLFLSTYEDMLHYEERMVDLHDPFYAEMRNKQAKFFKELCEASRVNPINALLYVKGIYDK